MRFEIYESAEDVGAKAAEYIVKRINDFAPTADRPFVLGLPTGANAGPGTVHGPRAAAEASPVRQGAPRS